MWSYEGFNNKNIKAVTEIKEVRKKKWSVLNEAAVKQAELSFAILGRRVFQKMHGLLRSWLLMSAGKYFPDNLMIGLCQITNWISSRWRRLHFLHARS